RYPVEYTLTNCPIFRDHLILLFINSSNLFSSNFAADNLVRLIINNRTPSEPEEVTNAGAHGPELPSV
ncbi:MAG: hypothetical protein ACE5EU_02010, partial [Paracoccaceae bacterium]